MNRGNLIFRTVEQIEFQESDSMRLKKSHQTPPCMADISECVNPPPAEVYFHYNLTSVADCKY